jgi:hypothetical protein
VIAAARRVAAVACDAAHDSVAHLAAASIGDASEPAQDAEQAVRQARAQA